MYLFDFSLDNISLMALTIAVGFVVDDAIVMLENIYRHVEEGISPFEAAIKGAGEIGFTIVSISASLIAVFIPLLLMGGIVGRLFREFAITVSIAVVVSAIVSLTLTPMMCSRFLAHESRQARDALPRHRAFLRGDAGLLPAHARGRAALPLRHADGVLRHRRADRLSLHRHSEGLLPGAGQRADPRRVRGGAGRLVRRDAEAYHRARQGTDERPGRRRLLDDDRCRCRRADGEQRALLHRAQAVRRAARDGAAGDRAAAPKAREGGGGEAVPQRGAGHPRGRQAVQDRVPVHAAGR